MCGLSQQTPGRTPGVYFVNLTLFVWTRGGRRAGCDHKPPGQNRPGYLSLSLHPPRRLFRASRLLSRIIFPDQQSLEGTVIACPG